MSNTAEKLQQPPQPYAGELVELNQVEEQLAELKRKFGPVPDYTTKAGYEQGKAAIKELTKVRTDTDKARLAITKPHRDFIDRVNQFGKSLIGEVEQLEGPHKDAKRVVDEAEQRKKEERIAKLRERLQKEVTSYLDTAVGLDSTGLADLITAAEAIDTDGYFDITKEAEDEKARVVRELSALHAKTLEQERLAAERAEIEREKAELAKLRAQQAPAEPSEPAPPAEPADPAEPRDVVTAGGTVFSHDDEPADPFGEALEDLQGLGLDPSQAVDVLSAIQRGEARHLSFTSGA